MESIVTAGDTVLLKPNLFQEKTYQTGAITNPAVIHATVRLVKEAGAKRVVVAEGAAVGHDTKEAFASSGVAEMQNQGVELVDFKNGESAWVVNPCARLFKRLRVPKCFLESNVVVNFPVMKTHDAVPATLGLKNMKGIIHETDKKRFHKWGLEQGIVDLNHIALPELTILDATIGMEGFGPVSGDPVNLGIVMASTDTVALDAGAARVMGMNPQEINYLQMAGRAGLGCTDPQYIEVVGCEVAEVCRPFNRISLSQGDYDRYGLRVIEEGACSGCSHFLETVAAKLIKNNDIQKLSGYTIVYGQTAEPPENVRDTNLITIGTCMRRHKHRGRYMPGCPPHPHDFEDRILSKL
ncbi:MAG: DUF362 domain-containing protein [Spirochaetota bacterium]